MRHISAARSNSRRSLVLMAGILAVGLAGCSSIDDAMFGPGAGQEPATAPGDTGDEAAPPPATSAPGTMTQSSAPAPAASSDSDSTEGAPPPASGGSMAGTLPAAPGAAVAAGPGVTVTPVPIEPGSDTGTAVGQKVAQLRADVSGLEEKLVSSAQQLGSLRAQAGESATAYHESKAHITTRLQLGTTRGNPELVAEWNSAQTSLDQLTTNINALNALGTDISNTSSRAHFDLDTIVATFNISGAVDEDHRQLSVLEDETDQTVVLIDRLMKEASETVERQTAYVANERASLTMLAAAIKNGELYGAELGGPMTGGLASNYSGSGSALVTIRFDHPGVKYEQILYSALSQALQSRPGAGFQIVGVTPTRGTASSVQLAQTEARRHAREVMRSMTDMGVPATRLSLSSSTDPSAAASEVRVYIR